jgi:hypothetical protein
VRSGLSGFNLVMGSQKNDFNNGNEYRYSSSSSPSGVTFCINFALILCAPKTRSTDNLLF